MEMVRARRLFFSSAEPGRSETISATTTVTATRAVLDICTASTPLPVPSIWGSVPEPQYDAMRFARALCIAMACRSGSARSLTPRSADHRPTAASIELRRGRRGPADERGRTPASLSPGDAALAILGAVVAPLWSAREQRTVIQRIDVEDAPHLAIVGQRHRDIDAAATADDLVGSVEAE